MSRFPFQIMRITMICSTMSKSCVPIACSPFTDSRRNSRATFASEGSRRGPLTGANQLEFSISMPASPASKFLSRSRGPGEDRGFNRFCQMCQAVRESTGKLEKIRRLAEYLLLAR